MPRFFINCAIFWSATPWRKTPQKLIVADSGEEDELPATPTANKRLYHLYVHPCSCLWTVSWPLILKENSKNTNGHGFGGRRTASYPYPQQAFVVSPHLARIYKIPDLQNEEKLPSPLSPSREMRTNSLLPLAPKSIHCMSFSCPYLQISWSVQWRKTSKKPILPELGDEDELPATPNPNKCSLYVHLLSISTNFLTCTMKKNSKDACPRWVGRRGRTPCYT